MNMHKLMIATSAVFVLAGSSAVYAQSALDKIIAAAKQEGDLNIVGGNTTLGGPESRGKLEEAFNKKYGLNMKVRFASGPSMPAMTARLTQEYKAGTKATSDLYIGTTALYAQLIKDGVLAEYKW